MFSTDKDLNIAETLLNEGKDFEAIPLLNKLVENPELSISEKILVSNLLIRLGDWENAFKVAEEACQKAQSSKDFFNSMHALLNMANSSIIIGDLEKSSKLLKAGEEIYKLLSIEPKIKLEEIDAYIAYLKGFLAFYQGDEEDSLKCFQKSLELRQIIGNKRNIAESLLGLSNFFRIVEVDIDKALNYVNQCLKIVEEVPYQRLLAKANVYLGHIYHVKGELEKSLLYNKTALAYFEKTNNLSSYLGTMNNMAITYRAQGNLDEAVELLTKCIDLSESLKNNWMKVGYNVTMVEVLLIKGDINKAKRHLERVKQLRDIENTPYINRDYKYTEALILKKSPRIQNRAKAENLFRSLIEDKNVVFDIKIEGLIQLCDLLIDELKITGEIEILEEIQPLINQLLNLTEKSHSYWYYAETYVLQAELALLTLDIKKARQLLTKAQNIAESHGFDPLVRKISSEHDDLLQKLNLWENLKESESSLSDRFELSNIDKQLKNMIQKRRNGPSDIKEEDPIMILVISEGGTPTFSNLFADTFMVEDDLISGFLSAFNTFSGELFSEGLDRASFGEFTLMMKPISRFLLCYIFKGQSFFAQKRIEHFIERLEMNQDLMNKFNEYHAINRVIELKDFPVLDSIINEVFPLKI